MRDLRGQFDLTGKVAVVTGASEGIGRDLAVGLAAAGADMIICSRNEGKLKEVKAEIEDIGRRAEVFVLDVCRLGDIEGLRNFIVKRFGKLEILINNAGYAVTKPAWDVTENEWDHMIDVGFKGLFFCCQIIGAIMRDKGYGKIINLSSTFSRSGVNCPIYVHPSLRDLGFCYSLYRQ